jgi:RNA polymerase sigma-70 factor (ECF subfamily)
MTARGSNEADLLSRVRAGDLEALAELYDSYGQRLYALAHRLTGSSSDAEDVVQDVFIGLPEALRHYSERDRADAWLKRVTARVALSRLRSEARRREISFDSAPQMSSRQENSGLTSALLEEALNTIPHSLRQVFLMKEADGYSHAEIADMLGITVGASQVRLHRAVSLLRERMSTKTGTARAAR